MTFVFSAPLPTAGFEAGLKKFAPRDGAQSLLGWEGQMSCLAAAVGERVRCLITPAPEMFFTATSFTLLARNAGLEPEALQGAIHLRFGPAREARLLRGIANFIANAETDEAELLAPGNHPFRQHNVVPAAMEAGLDLLPQARALFIPGGAALPRWPVPDVVAADLTAHHGGPLTAADCDGIDITGIDEFELPGWFGAAGARGGALLRRLLREHHAGVGRRLLLLPWNLARPAGTLAEAAAALHQAAGGATLPPVMLLLPFNLPATPGDGLIAQAERLKAVNAAAGAGCPDLWVARVVRPAAAQALGRLGAVALLDRNDPEAAWSASRLRACGIASRFLHADDQVSGSAEEFTDALGQRFQRVIRPDHAYLARLLAEEPVSRPAPPAPATQNETALWLNRFAPYWRGAIPAAAALRGS